ncbi:hypothetical protein KA082_02615 [Candidatus Woesebacteria bacterium]|nr:hypothetical protein [Candidatus Woesebacteria bacterium]
MNNTEAQRSSNFVPSHFRIANPEAQTGAVDTFLPVCLQLGEKYGIVCHYFPTGITQAQKMGALLPNTADVQSFLALPSGGYSAADLATQPNKYLKDFFTPRDVSFADHQSFLGTPEGWWLVFIVKNLTPEVLETIEQLSGGDVVVSGSVAYQDAAGSTVHNVVTTPGVVQ